LVGSATLVAVTTTGVAAATLGAVKIPSESTAPADELQVTAVSAVLATLALKRWTAPEDRTAESGEIVGTIDLVDVTDDAGVTGFTEQAQLAAIKARINPNSMWNVEREKNLETSLALGRGNAWAAITPSGY